MAAGSQQVSPRQPIFLTLFKNFPFEEALHEWLIFSFYVPFQIFKNDPHCQP